MRANWSKIKGNDSDFFEGGFRSRANPRWGPPSCAAVNRGHCSAVLDFLDKLFDSLVGQTTQDARPIVAFLLTILAVIILNASRGLLVSLDFKN